MNRKICMRVTKKLTLDPQSRNYISNMIQQNETSFKNAPTKCNFVGLALVQLVY
ncbi:MAG: hypothetical protein L0H53_06535 [Candidatus Nitrosocosmicus sp.]|nr:hypothetical protein [Candidatus Nitrosocosmicus sp.]